MPKRNAAYMRCRREQIIRAVIECISERGIENASISAICDRAGISTGALYKQFRDKDELVSAALVYGSDVEVAKPTTWKAFKKEATDLRDEKGFEKRKAVRARLYLYAEGSRPGMSVNLVKPHLLRSIDHLARTLECIEDVSLVMPARQTAMAIGALIDGMLLIALASESPLEEASRDISVALDCFVLRFDDTSAVP